MGGSVSTALCQWQLTMPSKTHTHTRWWKAPNGNCHYAPTSITIADTNEKWIIVSINEVQSEHWY